MLLLSSNLSFQCTLVFWCNLFECTVIKECNDLYVLWDSVDDNFDEALSIED